jgi:hypothetical protein
LGAELLLVVPQRADDDAQARDAVQHEHDHRVDRVAHQRRLRQVAEHDGDDQPELDHRDRQCEQDCAEGLPDPQRHHLGVVHGGQHRGQQRDDQHARREHTGTAVQGEVRAECGKGHGRGPGRKTVGANAHGSSTQPSTVSAPSSHRTTSAASGWSTAA